MASFYDLTAETLEGDAFAFADLKGKRVVIVNTASRCGYTRQYEPLEALHNEYKDQGLVVMGFPCNQFGRQEPGSAGDIREFCTKNYGVSFQMMGKVDVKGDNQHPVYAWLTQASLNGAGDHKVGWNFHKFLVNERGELVVWAAAPIHWEAKSRRSPAHPVEQHPSQPKARPGWGALFLFLR